MWEPGRSCSSDEQPLTGAERNEHEEESTEPPLRWGSYASENRSDVRGSNASNSAPGRERGAGRRERRGAGSRGASVGGAPVSGPFLAPVVWRSWRGARAARSVVRAWKAVGRWVESVVGVIRRWIWLGGVATRAVLAS